MPPVPCRGVLAAADGEAAVRLARRAVTVLLDPGAAHGPLPALSKTFEEPRGVFVTWRTHPGRDLRGCIGYPLPVLVLREAVEQAAVAAALDDPRFPPVRAGELTALTAEVSVLTLPAALPDADRPSWIRPGLDGVLVGSGRLSGLLLPQVAVEQGWNAEELLDGACEKAGLPPGAWRRPNVRVQTFQAEIFAEVEPRGPIRRARPDARG